MNKLFAGVFILLLGSTSVMADEYPTEETVRFALDCMNELGGLTDDNLYTCSCKYDAIRNNIVFSEYEEGRTYERNKKMPGEKGGAVRDNQRAKGFYEKLVKAREVADSSCIVVKHVQLVKPTSQ